MTVIGALSNIGNYLRPWAATNRMQFEAVFRNLRRLDYSILTDLSLGGVHTKGPMIIGPTGAFLVTIHKARGRVLESGDELRVGRHSLRQSIGRCLWEVRAVERQMGPDLQSAGISIVPILCVSGAELPSAYRRFGHVRLVTPETLVAAITSESHLLNSTLAAQLSATVWSRTKSISRHSAQVIRPKVRSLLG